MAVVKEYLTTATDGNNAFYLHRLDETLIYVGG